MKIRNKNSVFQSCRYCHIGDSLFRVDSEEGTFYVCGKHRDGKDFIKTVPVEGIEEEFENIGTVTKPGVIARAINYFKGG